MGKMNVEEESNEESEELALYNIGKTFEKDILEEKTRFWYGSLRSGQRVEYDGSLVIVGDVNYGAEICASGNIVVVGILRGIAHAGITGNKKAMISAMGINAPQIRIANVVKELPETRTIKRETVKIVENDITFEE